MQAAPTRLRTLIRWTRAAWRHQQTSPSSATGKDHLARNCTNEPKPGYKEPRPRQQRAVHFDAEDVRAKLSEMSVAEMTDYILERKQEIAQFTEEGMMG